jgi:hypothetical protein
LLVYPIGTNQIQPVIILSIGTNLTVVNLHCKKKAARIFQCGQRWREENDVGVRKFLSDRN